MDAEVVTHESLQNEFPTESVRESESEDVDVNDDEKRISKRSKISKQEVSLDSDRDALEELLVLNDDLPPKYHFNKYGIAAFVPDGINSEALCRQIEICLLETKLPGGVADGGEPLRGTGGEHQFFNSHAFFRHFFDLYCTPATFIPTLIRSMIFFSVEASENWTNSMSTILKVLVSEYWHFQADQEKDFFGYDDNIPESDLSTVLNVAEKLVQSVSELSRSPCGSDFSRLATADSDLGKFLVKLILKLAGLTTKRKLPDGLNCRILWLCACYEEKLGCPSESARYLSECERFVSRSGNIMLNTQFFLVNRLENKFISIEAIKTKLSCQKLRSRMLETRIMASEGDHRAVYEILRPIATVSVEVPLENIVFGQMSAELQLELLILFRKVNWT